MKIHYDHVREGWWIESRVLAWLVDTFWPSSTRVWLVLFVVAYLACVAGLILEVARCME